MPEQAPPETRDPTQPVTAAPPIGSLRLVFWLLVLWTVMGWLRFAQTLQNRELILALTYTGHLYLSVWLRRRALGPRCLCPRFGG